MTNFKFRGKCGGCGKTKWFIRKRVIRLPIGQNATSQKLFCGSCYKEIKSI